MKSFIRSFIIHLAILWITPEVFNNAFLIPRTLNIIVTAAFFFTLLHIFVRPFLKILLLPITIVTFGLASWLVHVILLYLLMLLIPQISISAWHFPEFSYQGFVIPETTLMFLPTLAIVALFMALIKAFLEFLID